MLLRESRPRSRPSGLFTHWMHSPRKSTWLLTSTLVYSIALKRNSSNVIRRSRPFVCFSLFMRIRQSRHSWMKGGWRFWRNPTPKLLWHHHNTPFSIQHPRTASLATTDLAEWLNTGPTFAISSPSHSSPPFSPPSPLRAFHFSPTFVRLGSVLPYSRTRFSLTSTTALYLCCHFTRWRCS